MQSMPLNIKVRMTQNRIRGWVDEYGEDGVYVSFSGGKDSTVLLDIVRKMYPGIVAVFVDTGLEYPEIRDFVKTFDNVEWLKPKKTFRQVIEEYGYPFISKEVSERVYGARRYLEKLRERERVTK
jgi:3'-phosphoadenosine 5'-phosphosulfate sulfotransferase (PAPS reductase)/FAD synthetase